MLNSITNEFIRLGIKDPKEQERIYQTLLSFGTIIFKTNIKYDKI